MQVPDVTGETVGVTDATFAVAPPPFASVSVKLTDWPTVAVVRDEVNALTPTVAGSWAVTAIPVTAGATVAPVFASVATTVAPNVTVPAAEGVQVQPYASVAPPAIVCAPAGEDAVQVPAPAGATVGATDATFAVAPPRSRARA